MCRMCVQGIFDDVVRAGPHDLPVTGYIDSMSANSALDYQQVDDSRLPTPSQPLPLDEASAWASSLRCTSSAERSPDESVHRKMVPGLCSVSPDFMPSQPAGTSPGDRPRPVYTWEQAGGRDDVSWYIPQDTAHGAEMLRAVPAVQLVSGKYMNRGSQPIEAAIQHQIRADALYDDTDKRRGTGPFVRTKRHEKVGVKPKPDRPLKPQRVTAQRTTPIVSIWVSGDGCMAYALVATEVLELNMRAGRVSCRFQCPEVASPFTCISVEGSQTAALVGCEDGTVLRFELSTGKTTVILPSDHAGAVLVAQDHTDETGVHFQVVVSANGVVTLVPPGDRPEDLVTHNCGSELRGPAHVGWISPDARHCFLGGNGSTVVRLEVIYSTVMP